MNGPALQPLRVRRALLRAMECEGPTLVYLGLPRPPVVRSQSQRALQVRAVSSQITIQYTYND